MTTSASVRFPDASAFRHCSRHVQNFQGYTNESQVGSMRGSSIQPHPPAIASTYPTFPAHRVGRLENVSVKPCRHSTLPKMPMEG